ncbi:hypothetical protein MVEG_00451 [Podila verticillata NRRL 6337]|nr:hypothetical protein MVEG_00451 [Podila verticillata NRRL 6337]
MYRMHLNLNESVPLLSKDCPYFSSSNSEANSTDATDSVDDLILLDDKDEVEDIVLLPNGPAANVDESLDFFPQPVPEHAQGSVLFTVVFPRLSLRQVLASRDSVRQVLCTSTSVSVVCLILYQTMLPTHGMPAHIFLQVMLWVMVAVTRHSLHSGYLPVVFIASIAMAWIWHETYLGRASFAEHGPITNGPVTKDTCPHARAACQVLFGMVVTTIVAALCYAAEIGLFFYSEYGPGGNLWLEDEGNGLMENFQRGHVHQESVEHLSDAHGNDLRVGFARQNEFVTEMFPLVRPTVQAAFPTAQSVNVHPARDVPCSTGQFYCVVPPPSEQLVESDDEEVAFHTSDEGPVDPNDAAFQTFGSNSDDESDSDDDVIPYNVGYIASAMSLVPATVPTSGLIAEMGAPVVAPVEIPSIIEAGSVDVDTLVEPCSVAPFVPPSVEILSPRPVLAHRVSTLLRPLVTLSEAANMTIMNQPHQVVSPHAAATSYSRAQFQVTPWSIFSHPPPSSPPMPMGCPMATTAYAYNDPIVGMTAAAHWNRHSNVDDECMRRRMVLAKHLMDQQLAAGGLPSLTLLAALATADDWACDEESWEDEEEEEKEVVEEKMSSSSRPLGALLQETDEDEEGEWDTDEELAEARTIERLLSEEARVNEPADFYDSSKEEGGAVVDTEGRVIAWLCDDKFGR